MNLRCFINRILNKTSIVLTLITVFLFSTSVSADSHWQKNNYIASSFSNIALNSVTPTGSKRISKWDNDINYYFDHRIADDTLHESLTNMHLAHLADITGVNFKQTNNLEQANLVIIFSQEKNMLEDFTRVTRLRASSHLKKLTKQNSCLTYSTFKSSSRIRHATVLVAVDRARAHASLVTCIVEELSEIMGLHNASERVYPSIFNNKSPET